MAKDRRAEVEALFEEAIELPPEEREAFLEKACGEDESLRKDVETLLAAYEEAPTFLERGAMALGQELGVGDPADEPADLRGETIGPYRIEELIGRGGMSVVYRAERADGAFEQTVALKLLPAYFETDERVVRFRAERQILAALDHPNIARLLDGGTTAEGHPYLAMEYVEGISITEYAARAELPVDARVQLLQDVLSALQFAHRNLVVHRDIKPSNILVTENGEVKLLDFGIAKLLGPQEQALTQPLTRTGQRFMTPEYAAPEQVRGGTISTATDVYQAGVLAYELLTGVRPFDLTDKTPSQIEQIVVEEVPPKPSTAVTHTSGTDRTQPPARQGAELDGDLDTIVLKAMAKEPERRYTSAEAFRDDLRRYQEGRPVEARAPTMRYRARKFVKRNRWPVGTGAAALVLLVVFVAALMQQRAVAVEERDRATMEAEKAERVTDFLTDLLEAEAPDQAQGREVTVREVLEEGTRRIDEELGDQPEIQATLYSTTGRVYRQMGELDTADSLLQHAVATAGTLPGEQGIRIRAEALQELGHLRNWQRDSEGAEAKMREALQLLESIYEQHEELASAYAGLAEVLRTNGDYAAAIELNQQALEMFDVVWDSPEETVAVVLSNQGLAHHQTRDYRAAENYYREALSIFDELGIESSRGKAAVLHNAGGLARATGQYVAADSFFQQAVAVDRLIHGDEHPSTATSIANHGMNHRLRGAYMEAEETLTEAISILSNVVEDSHPALTLRRTNLLATLTDTGRFDEALALLERIRSDRAERSGESEDRFFYLERAIINEASGRFEEAESDAWQALSASKEDEHPDDKSRSLSVIRSVLQAQGKKAEAVSYAERSAKVYLGSNAISTSGLYRVLALVEAYRKADRVEDAEAKLAVADSTVEAAFAPHSRPAQLALRERALLLHQAGEHAQALELLYDVRDWKRTTYREEHHARAVIAGQLASVHAALGNRSKADDYLEDALQRAEGQTAPWAIAVRRIADDLR